MKPCSSHRQMPSPFIAFSWEVCSCLEQQDMHGLYAALQLIGLKPLRLHYNPHSYQSSANALNSLTKTVFLPLKIFPNTFSHCMLKTFLASKWSPLPSAFVAVKAWMGGTDSLPTAVHGDVRYLSGASDPPHMLRFQALYIAQWPSGEQREGQQPKDWKNYLFLNRTYIAGAGKDSV